MTVNEKRKVIVDTMANSRYFSRWNSENMMNFLYRLEEQGIIKVQPDTVPTIAKCMLDLAHYTKERD